ncbi:MAG: helix-turn-helix transcriptional regulator [Gammaproteobacteria bacterium]|nr:helix-turn-helix transcriptional regulator [Gammaproteobacteria bacterium]
MGGPCPAPHRPLLRRGGGDKHGQAFRVRRPGRKPAPLHRAHCTAPVRRRRRRRRPALGGRTLRRAALRRAHGRRIRACRAHVQAPLPQGHRHDAGRVRPGLRIDEAKRLLETGDEPVESISQRVGYEDPTSFRRLFKRATGLTPGRYRQRYRKIATPEAWGA